MLSNQSARHTVKVVLRRSLAVVMMVLFAGLGSIVEAGTPPLLKFDVPFSISCRILPMKDSTRVEPGKKLIEVVIPISARVTAGAEKDLKHILYTLVDPSEPETLSVTDWLPRTELKTEFAKPIQLSKERMAKIGINLSAHYIVAASGEAGGQLKSAVAYEMLPPQEIVLASGTLQHAHGVYFQLKPSSQTTVEGMKSFSAIFSVPKNWRGGYLKIQCEAQGLDRAVISRFDREVISGQAVFYPALHLVGDKEAENLADNMARSQLELFDAITQSRQDGKSGGQKAFAWLNRLAKRSAIFDKSNSPVEDLPDADEWGLLNNALEASPGKESSLDEFPRPVQEKLRALQQAAKALHVLSAGDPINSHASAPASRSPSPSPRATVLGVSSAKKSNPEPRTAQRGAFVTSSKKEDPKTESGPSSSPRLGFSAEPEESANEANTGNSISDSPREETSSNNTFSKDFPKQASYLLVSIWGALFTYIVAPLVVEFIRKRMSEGGKRQPRAKRASTPRTAGRPHGVTLPSVCADSLVLVPQYVNPKMEGFESEILPPCDQGPLSLGRSPSPVSKKRGQ